MTTVIQLGGSLAGIMFLAWLATRLGLGGDVRLRSEAEARELARAAHFGFKPIAIVLDRAGIGALLRDAEGHVMLLKRTGIHFAARMIDSPSGTQLDRNFLTLSTGDRWFGSVTLDLGAEAQTWASGLRSLSGKKS